MQSLQMIKIYSDIAIIYMYMHSSKQILWCIPSICILKYMYNAHDLKLGDLAILK